jgi:hypothetical protein
MQIDLRVESFFCNFEEKTFFCNFEEKTARFGVEKGGNAHERWRTLSRLLHCIFHLRFVSGQSDH